MNIRATIAFIALVPALAHASYELVLVTDWSTRTVHRFDGDTGTYLGSFGKNHFDSPDGIAINPALGHAYVADQFYGTVSVFEYSTGAFIREWKSLVGALNVSLTSAGDVLVAGLTGTVRYSPTGALLNSYNSLQSFGVMQGSDGSVYSVDAAGTLRRYPLAGGSPTFTSAAGYADTWQMTPRGSQGLIANYLDKTIDLLQTGTAPTVSTLVSTSSKVELLGVAYGHDSRMFAVGRDVTDGVGGTVAVYSALTRTYRGSFGENVLVEPRCVAVVVAPEPASLAALGLGASALALRRRRLRRG